MTATISSLLAYALTGQEFALESCPDVDCVLAELEDRGWSQAAIADQARQAWSTGQTWPYPIDTDQFATLSAARWYAWLIQARDRLDLAVEHRGPSHRTTLTDAERRLLAEVPPHHGSVG
ncbi:MAG: hypothetical protein LBV06_11230 [Propionibacteriaceae bacterium]|jgi:hypothetical protein|nr:hypothetical protein [Propionibacteriaceae bacterium]